MCPLACVAACELMGLGPGGLVWRGMNTAFSQDAGALPSGMLTQIKSHTDHL